MVKWPRLRGTLLGLFRGIVAVDQRHKAVLRGVQSPRAGGGSPPTPPPQSPRVLARNAPWAGYFAGLGPQYTPAALGRWVGAPARSRRPRVVSRVRRTASTRGVDPSSGRY